MLSATLMLRANIKLTSKNYTCDRFKNEKGKQNSGGKQSSKT